MNFAFYISGQSTRLFNFLKDASDAERNSVKFVFSNKLLESNLKRLIQKLKISFFERDFNDFAGDTREEKRLSFSDELLKNLLSHEIDYCFSFSKYLIAGDILKRYKNKIINFHPAILPMYPGFNAIDQAVNDTRSVLLIGNTAHFIDEGMDTGSIIMQYVVPMQTFFDSDRDYHVVMNAMNIMLLKLIRLLEQNKVYVDENNRVHIKGANYNAGFIFPAVE